MDAETEGELPQKLHCDECDKETIVSRCETHKHRVKTCYPCHLKKHHMEKL